MNQLQFYGFATVLFLSAFINSFFFMGLYLKALEGSYQRKEVVKKDWFKNCFKSAVFFDATIVVYFNIKQITIKK